MSIAQKRNEIISYITRLKKEFELKIIDIHVHPLDVMGILHPDEYSKDKEILKRSYLNPSSMEKMKFGKLSNILSGLAYKYFPRAVIDEIKAAYNNPFEKRILGEMEKSLVDQIVLLPIAPWVKTEDVYNYYNNKNFLLLGSFDICGIKIEKIEPKMDEYVNNFKIIGLKLHPNLQNFKPQPGDNTPQIKEKLELIYSLAEKNNLFLLFHGGTTNFTEYRNIRYENFARSRNNGRLENFCDPAGKSEILGKYNIPIIIAHLGHYGLNKINYNLLKIISQKFDNVYFDTAGISPKLIQKGIELMGSKKIVLGSDALYNRMAYSIYFIYEAAEKIKTKEKLNDIMLNILGNNFYSNILKRK